ncbi:MAG TPA: hypothetical protein EYQ64_05235, partial [Gemmatimonadetes bacterium]|nr:hypothetical protein [Gemmatimonadota bacterium]
DQEIILEEGRPWKVSWMDTQVDRVGRNPLQWTARLNASLDQVMQGRPRPAQLRRSELLMDEALEEGRLKPGMNLLLVAFGAGFTWGAMAVRW